MIAEFLLHLQAEQRCSPHTVEAYERDIRQFAEFCSPADGIFDFGQATASDIRDWVGSLADSGMTATTLRRKIESLRAFYRWARKTDRLRKNPAADVTLPKLRKLLPNFIKESDVESLLEVEPAPDDFEAQRSYIIIDMLYSPGLRQAELLALTDSDINTYSCELRVTGKRNKTRVLPIPPELCRRIAAWQTIRDERYPELPTPLR